MNNYSWKKHLNQTLTTTAKNKGLRLKLALVGIGNELNGDDAAGVIAVQQINKNVHPSPNHLIIIGGLAPENYLGKITEFGPDVVILVDAADLENPPGTITLLPWDLTTGFSASTHTLPPYVMAEYLTTAISCQVFIIGIQPQQVEFTTPLSPVIEEAVKEITGEFIKLLSPA